MYALPRRAIVLVAVVSLMSACGDAGGTGTPTPPASSPAVSTFGGTDTAWIEINIAMNEELVPLLDLAPRNSADATVQRLAAEVKAGHEGELTILRRLHDQAKLPTENPHKGMPMPGMVLPATVTEAAGKRGAAFDALLVKHLREHLDQGVKLAESETRAGIEPATLALARRAVTDRKTFLATLSGK